MRTVATQLSDARVNLNSIAGRLTDLEALDGKHKPDESLREVNDAIHRANFLLAQLADLRQRYVGAVLAKDASARRPRTTAKVQFSKVQEIRA